MISRNFLLTFYFLHWICFFVAKWQKLCPPPHQRKSWCCSSKISFETKRCCFIYRKGYHRTRKKKFKSLKQTNYFLLRGCWHPKTLAKGPAAFSPQKWDWCMGEGESWEKLGVEGEVKSWRQGRCPGCSGGGRSWENLRVEDKVGSGFEVWTQNLFWGSHGPR